MIWPWIVGAVLYLGISAGICAWVAKTKGRDPWLWLQLGLTLGIIGVAAALFMQRPCAVVARAKDRDINLWLTLGVRFGDVAVFALLLLESRPAG
jgi:hypothetical protein